MHQKLDSCIKIRKMIIFKKSGYFVEIHILKSGYFLKTDFDKNGYFLFPTIQKTISIQKTRENQ